MKSKTSFFNMTVLRKDITRFAPAWALYLIGGLLVGLDTIGSSGGFSHSARDLAQSIPPLTILNFLYALLTAQLLFGDLFNSRLCNALHAFPLRRECWFVTHTVAGLLFSFAPNLILCICFLPFLGELWFISFIWLLGVTLQYLVFFGLAAFSASCTGNRFAMAAVYALLNFGSLIVYWFVDTFYAPLLYGVRIRSDGFFHFCPTVQLCSIQLVDFVRYEIHNYNYSFYDYDYRYAGLSSDWGYVALWAAVGIALLGVALLLYKRRKLESAGDFMAFSRMKPIFSVVFTLSVGALFEIFGEPLGGLSYVFLTVGIIVGYFVGQMLLQRTVRVFRWKAVGACAAIGGALVLSVILTALDPLGITRWTPNPDKVEQITLSDSYYYDTQYTQRAQTITSPELIGELVDIHQQILSEGELTRHDNNVSAITIVYKLTDGRQIERRYYYRENGIAAERLKAFFNSPEFIMGYMDWEDYLSSIAKVNVDIDGNPQTVYGEQAQELLSAIRADCEAGVTFEDENYWYYCGSVSVIYENGEGCIFPVYSVAVNTIAWIKENT